MQYGHAGQHHGIGTPDCPRELHHHHDERCVSPLDDRRERAREAYWDEAHAERTGSRDIETAIETATRVQITPEIEAAARGALEDHYGGSVRPIIEAAMRAAGFEVEA